METTTKKGTSLGQRIKACIKRDSAVYWIPSDIWKEFLWKYVDAKSLTRLAQTSSVFTELVKHVCENNVRVAWECRKENQIPLARKWLLSCAENGNKDAMFHLGFALKTEGGWGYAPSPLAGLMWLKKAAKDGHVTSMALCPTFFQEFEGSGDSDDENYWDDEGTRPMGASPKELLLVSQETRSRGASPDEPREAKILASGNAFAIGWWWFSESRDFEKLISYFKESAEKDNNEYAQYYLAFVMENYTKCSRPQLYVKAADDGFAMAQRRVSEIILYHCLDNSKTDEICQKIADRYRRSADNQCCV